MASPSGDHWYVLRTKARAEALVTSHLARKGLGVYFPRLARPDLGGVAIGRRQELEPLFPGYLFVRIDLGRDFHLVAWTPGVRDFLSFGRGLPDPIDGDVVEFLRERAGGGDIIRPRAVPLEIGARVEVTRGPFAGLIAIVDRPSTPAGRIHVLLDLLKRKTGLELPISAVAPA